MGQLPAGATVGDKWATQIMLETRDNVGNAITRSAIDFVMEAIAGNQPSCTLETPLPSNGFEVNIGSSLSIDFRVSDADNPPTLEAIATAISTYGYLYQL